MPSTIVPLEAAPLNAAAFLFALGPRRVVVGLVRLLADRIENGGWRRRRSTSTSRSGGCPRRPLRPRRAGSTPACSAP